MTQNIFAFAYYSVSEHSTHFFFIFEKNLHFLAEGGGSIPPPQLADAHAKNASFLTRSLRDPL